MDTVTINRDERDAIRYHVGNELAMAADDLSNHDRFDESSPEKPRAIMELAAVLDAIGWASEGSADSYEVGPEHIPELRRGRADAVFYVEEDETRLERIGPDWCAPGETVEQVRAEAEAELAWDRARLAAFDAALGGFPEPVAALRRNAALRNQ